MAEGEPSVTFPNYHDAKFELKNKTPRGTRCRLSGSDADTWQSKHIVKVNDK